MQLNLPDGTVVLAHGRLDLVPVSRPRTPDFALYLDERWRSDRKVTWPHRLISWEDFGLPNDEEEVYAAVLDLRERAGAGELIEVACYGGVGRTGTVLGCLLVLQHMSAEEAVLWLRRYYHPRSVETPEQQQLIARFAASRPSELD